MSRREHGPEDELTQIQRAVVENKHRLKPDLSLPILRDRADRLLGVLDAMGVWVIEFDGDVQLQYSSPQSESIIGYTAEECLTSDCLRFHSDDLYKIALASRTVRETGETATNEVRIQHREGHWVWVHSSIAGWYPSEGGDFHTVCFVRDLSELKRAEAARKESEARHHAVARVSCDLIIEVDDEGRPSYIAPGSEEILGYAPDEVLTFEPWALVHPDDKARIVAQLADEFRNEAQGELGTDSINRPRRIFEFRVRHRDGHWLWFETMGLVYQRADEEKRYLAVSRDVTDRRREEQARRELEESMRSSQKLESLGVLAGGIAHDFNNLLTPILGAAGLALKDLPVDSPVRASLRKIQQAAERATGLTDQMLAYAGQKPLGVSQLDLSKLVREMRDLVASSISGKTRLELALDDELPMIEAEAAQLSQVVMNLIMNAAESLRDGEGRIEVRTGVVDFDSPPTSALFAESMEPGKHVYFEVSDTGCGMDSDTRAHIFDPFFTTKFTGRGLGLAAVAGIVRGHRGAIEVDSAPGRGTRFRVLLPVSDDAGTGDSQESGSSFVEDALAGTVLVIDDDEGVREIAAELLRRSGMTVLTASDGHEGLKLFGLHADSIDVILLDRTMPELSGADTFDAIRALRQDARIVLVSGYTEERATAELTDRDLTGFLRKPFSPETLLAAVREALDD